ncbi:MAG: hypothetical protein AB7E32_07835 [Desulfovibrio sp.]
MAVQNSKPHRDQRDWKRCPNCGSVRFFVDAPETGLVFFRSNSAGTLFSTSEPAAPLADMAGMVERFATPDTGSVYCVHCGWHGVAEELAPPRAPDAGETCA